MRKTLLASCAAATMAMTAPAVAQDYYHGRYAAPVTGAVVGTVAGVGLYHGWWGSSAAVSSLPASAAGAAAAGFVGGVGTAVLIHAATTPCQGLHFFFSGLLTSPRGCVNGRWVGDRVVRRGR